MWSKQAREEVCPEGGTQEQRSKGSKNFGKTGKMKMLGTLEMAILAKTKDYFCLFVFLFPFSNRIFFFFFFSGLTRAWKQRLHFLAFLATRYVVMSINSGHEYLSGKVWDFL